MRPVRFRPPPAHYEVSPKGHKVSNASLAFLVLMGLSSMEARYGDAKLTAL